MNAVEIEAAVSELALQPFDAAEFPFAFLAALHTKLTTKLAAKAERPSPQISPCKRGEGVQAKAAADSGHTS